MEDEDVEVTMLQRQHLHLQQQHIQQQQQQQLPVVTKVLPSSILRNSRYDGVINSSDNESSCSKVRKDYRQEQLHVDTIHNNGNAVYPMVQDTQSHPDDNDGSNDHDAAAAATAAAADSAGTVISHNTLADILQSNTGTSSLTTFTSLASPTPLPPPPPPPQTHKHH